MFYAVDRPQCRGGGGHVNCGGWADLVLADQSRGTLIFSSCGDAPVAVAPATPTPAVEPSGVAESGLAFDAGTLEIGTEFAPRQLRVGENVGLQLTVPRGSRMGVSGRCRRLGGHSGGHLVYEAKACHEGLWSVAIRVREGVVTRWSGVNLTVLDAD